MIDFFFVDSDPFPTSLRRADPFWSVGLAETFAFKQNVEWIAARTVRTWDQFEWVQFSSSWWRCLLQSQALNKLHHPNLPNFFPRQKKILHDFEVHLPGFNSKSLVANRTSVILLFMSFFLPLCFSLHFFSLSFLAYFLSSFFLDHWIMNMVSLISRNHRAWWAFLRNRSQLVMWQ